MSHYRDLREFIKTLDQHGKLIKVSRPIRKDTELAPLVRWQYRGLPESERKAFLFDHVVREDGRPFAMKVLIGAMAGSREIYALGLQCEVGGIQEKWASALKKPIDPVMVESGPCQEVVLDEESLNSLGLDIIPVPVSTPGFDNAPYISAGHWVTKDPHTGVRNIGNYRGQLKGPTRLGINHSPTKHIGRHWDACRRLGKPLEVAISIGVMPNLCYAAVTKVPYGTDEYTVAGGISGEPVALVKCRTVDLEVPASAEIIIEGKLSTTHLEDEGPHGEFHGYIGPRHMMPFVEVTCITHRRDAIFCGILSQFPPSESSKIRQIGQEGIFFKYLRDDSNIPGVKAVAMHEAAGSAHFCVIQMKKFRPSDTWQALHAFSALNVTDGKYVVVVDEDIDPWDLQSVVWAMAFRTQPIYDVRIISGKAGGIDPATNPPGSSRENSDFPPPYGASGVLIDATRKWDYPPVSLPAKPYMERARQIWEELSLPPLSPMMPWHGYELGRWDERDRREAELATQGRYFETGEVIRSERKALDHEGSKKD